MYTESIEEVHFLALEISIKNCVLHNTTILLLQYRARF